MSALPKLKLQDRERICPKGQAEELRLSQGTRTEHALSHEFLGIPSFSGWRAAEGVALYREQAAARVRAVKTRILCRYADVASGMCVSAQWKGHSKVFRRSTQQDAAA